MYPDEITYIQKQLRKGVPEGELKEEFKTRGYSPVQVDRLFDRAVYRDAKTLARQNTNFLASVSSLLIIGLGCMNLGNPAAKTWGIMLIITGSLGLILKMVFRNSS